MTDPRNSNNLNGLPNASFEEGVSMRTRLLRAAADGELTDSEQAMLDLHLLHHPADRAVIEFERQLKGAIANAASVAPPESLRQWLETIRPAAHVQSLEMNAPAHTDFGAGVIAGRIRRLRWLAAAACVALLAGALTLVLPSLLNNGPDVTRPAQAYRTALVSFISSQHELCELHADQIGSRFKITRLEDAPAEFEAILGRAPDLGEIEAAGFTLLGAGPCAVPGRGRSVRLVLAAPGSEPFDIVSIHIQQDTGDLPMQSGRTYRLTEAGHAGHDEPHPIFTWRRDGFVYFLTSRSEAVMHVAREALGAADPSGTI